MGIWEAWNRPLRVAAVALAASATGFVACSGADTETGSTAGADGGAPQPTVSAAQLNGAEPLTIARTVASSSQLRAAYEHPPQKLRPRGDGYVPVVDMEGPAYDVDTVVPELSGDALVVKPIGRDDLSLSMVAESASADVTAELTADGRVLYPKMYGSADVLRTVEPERLRETIVLHDAESPSYLRWSADLGATGSELTPKRLDNNVIALVDAEGYSRLELGPITIVDAEGNERSTAFEYHDGIFDARIDHRLLAYPAIVDYGIQAPPPGKLAMAPTQVKGRVMVLLDTSGSMVWRFSDTTSVFGDSDSSAIFCDNALGTSFACSNNVACTTANGGVPYFPFVGEPSRLFASKAALNNVVNAHAGLLDFGLTRFIQNGACADAEDCCIPRWNGPGFGRCWIAGDYADIPTDSTPGNMTYNGGCGTSTNGGTVLVQPGPSSAPQVQEYIDYQEDFCSSVPNVNGARARNRELRAVGGTPLARSVRTARTQWYQPVFNASSGDSNYDPILDCRAYVLVVMTDGEDTCGGDPSGEVQTLTNVNSTNPVKTYVLGMGNTSGLDIPELNQMATAGGTGSPALASSQSEIEAAFADIVAETVKFEVCNDADDNCNALIDEGLGVYQECTQNSQCGSNNCNQGRCACTNNSQCASGNSCAAGFCRPACTVGVGACRNAGVRKCSGGANACCVDDGSSTCTALQPLPPGTEVCNGLDDNCNGIIDDVPGGCQGCIVQPEVCNGIDDDCDGTPDNNLTDVGQPCGQSIGICMPGTTTCTNGTLGCQGGTPPGTESCNGLDDNCDGTVDGLTRPCYSGPGGTQGVGICRGGSQSCPAGGSGNWGACVGEQTPQTETCNGLDDNCNNVVDDVAGVGNSCCPSGNCGTGICVAGTLQCSGGSLQCFGHVGPSPEVCNGIDDDCNGTIDDVAGVGDACCPSGNCGIGVCTAGVRECQGNQLVCNGASGPSAEICNNLDDDCNGSVDDLPNAGQACCPAGISCGTGICSDGTLQCAAGSDTLQCLGFTGPATEVCNGDDDDCNGLVDDVPGAGDTCCTSGACGVGICKEGVRRCVGSGLQCVGEVLPGTEVCNQLDDDCNGSVDDVPGLGNSCCPFQDSQGADLCGTGICTSGQLQCQAGQVNPVCVGAQGPVPEECDGIDNDCNGVVDDLPSGTVGGPCCPSGKCGTGVCTAGTLACGPTGIECTGAVNPSGEICDGLDNDCDGTIDDVPGLGTECCPSGLCGQGVCQSGVLQCGQNGLECAGEVGPDTEVCDGVDNDCDGVVDDVPGIGEPCCPGGGNAPDDCNKGICRPGTRVCDGNALVCQGGVGPENELCDGTDNDCDGAVDEDPDVTTNDPAIGVPCDVPVPPDDNPPCAPGTTICQGAKAVCDGAVGPGTEVCNGRDDDCDGVIDDGELCETPAACINGSCVNPCSSGEFPCPGGFVCEDGYCIDPTQGSGGAAGAGSGGSSAAGGSGGSAAAGGSSAAGGSGGSSAAGGAAGAGAGAGGTAASAGSSGSSAGDGGPGGGEAPPQRWGLATGGGGCSCRTTGEPVPFGAALAASMLVLGAAVRRRRSRGEVRR